MSRVEAWDDSDKFRGCKDFAGRPAEWEEWSEKFLGNVKARSPVVFDILKAVQHQLAERELEAEDYIVVVHALDIEMPTQKEIESISFKMHRLLSDLTTQEANSTVRRCRNGNGMLAWKRLTATHNPKTLASGLKALMGVHSPPKIMDNQTA